jgi:hypothetical protein
VKLIAARLSREKNYSILRNPDVLLGWWKEKLHRKNPII